MMEPFQGGGGNTEPLASANVKTMCICKVQAVIYMHYC